MYLSSAVLSCFNDWMICFLSLKSDNKLYASLTFVFLMPVYIDLASSCYLMLAFNLS